MHEAEPFRSTFARAMSALHTGGQSQVCIGPHDGAKDESLPGRFFEMRFRLLDRGILFQRDLKKSVQRYSPGARRDRSRKKRPRARWQRRIDFIARSTLLVAGPDQKLARHRDRARPVLDVRLEIERFRT